MAAGVARFPIGIHESGAWRLFAPFLLPQACLPDEFFDLQRNLAHRHILTETVASNKDDVVSLPQSGVQRPRNLTQHALGSVPSDRVTYAFSDSESIAVLAHIIRKYGEHDLS
jgi:hypothetical protein